MNHPFAWVILQQAVEKGSPASLHSIASLRCSYKYASARRFLARLASETFLNSLNHSFPTLCHDVTAHLISHSHSFQHVQRVDAGLCLVLHWRYSLQD